MDTWYTFAVVSTPLQPVMARATALLERGQAAAAAQVLSPLLETSHKRSDELIIRSALAEALLLQGDVSQAHTTLGRTPDAVREPLPPVLISTLWRLHGRVAYAKGDQSRAIALQNSALKHADAAHESRSIGLAHYELALCYTKVGDTAIVREHEGRVFAERGERRGLRVTIELAEPARERALRSAEPLAASAL